MISRAVLTLGLWAGVNDFHEGTARNLTDPLTKLQVHICDKQTGRSMPARVYLADRAGKHWNPEGAVTYA